MTPSYAVGPLKHRSITFTRTIAALLMAFYLFQIAAGAASDATPNFRLTDAQGRSHELYRQGDVSQVALLFLDLNQQSTAAILESYGDYRESEATGPQRNLVIAIHAESAPAALARYVDLLPPDVPLLLDEQQLITHALGATRHGEMRLVQTENWQVLRRGLPTLKPQGMPAFAGAWITEDAVSRPFSYGSPLDLLPAPTALSYANDVAPILIARCVSCHQVDAVGPFAFNSYKKARGWADMTREVLLTQRMPPWHADPHYGRFQNDRALSGEEKRTLIAWIDAGAPRGEGEDPLAQRASTAQTSWANGTPDQVLTMATPFPIPASGVLDYQLLTVPTGLTEDTWVRAVEMRPGNPNVVHHALIFIQYPDEKKGMEPAVDGGASGYFAGYVPGGNQDPYPTGTAKFIPAGASFVFQIHYVTTGKEETDQSSLGLYFYEGTPERRLVTRSAFNASFQITPGVQDYPVEDDHRVWPGDVILYSLSPHMHYRGSRFKYTAEYPSGDSEVLLSVPNYNFDWQTSYVLDPPKVLPKGTVIRCEGAFDNSPENPFNPDPTSTVGFGDQTYEEMFIGYMNYSAPVGAIEAMQERWRKRQAEGREALMAQQATTPGTDMLSAETLLKTEWTGGQFRLRFQADGVLLVNGSIKGTYTISEENRVIIDVVGEHFELDIVGQKLFSGTYELTRLESSDGAK